MDFKETFKKFWFLLWKDNSFKGWIFSIVFIFILIKFIFFPVLGIFAGFPLKDSFTGNALPLAIVESCSMYHGSNFNEYWTHAGSWYEEKNISMNEFSEFSLKNGFNKGDILFIRKVNPEKLKVGDIIVFNAEQRNPIIHRIVSLNPVQTKGDNWKTNPKQIEFEKDISQQQIMGKATLIRIPFFGWVKLAFFDWKKQVDQRGFCN
jgi:signal peptidase I